MRFKHLGRYRKGGTSDRMHLAIPLPKTPDGRVYRYSPNEEAHPRHFVIGDRTEGFETTMQARQRMKLEPGSGQTVCPYSGIVGDDDEFTHPDDVEAARKLVEHAAVADVEDELARILGNFNRGQSRNSLIRIEAKTHKRYRPKPRFGRRDLLRELVCEHCGRDYGVYAIGLYCPDCGAPNLRLHFAREVKLVQAQVDIAEAQTKQNQELAYRLLGNAHEDVLTAFEATLKTVYLHMGSGKPDSAPPKNAFQSLEQGRRRFAEFNLDPFACLCSEQFGVLALNIQKRHVIGHNLGVVDAKFAEHAKSARVGETVHLVGDDIRAFAEMAQLVINDIDSWLVDGADGAAQ